MPFQDTSATHNLSDNLSMIKKQRTGTVAYLLTGVSQPILWSGYTQRSLPPTTIENSTRCFMELVIGFEPTTF